MENEYSNKIIGRVVGTERRPNTAFEFHFWAQPDVPIGIGSLVVAASSDNEQRHFGVIVEALGYNDLTEPLSEYINLDYQPEHSAITRRPEIRLYKAAVLRRLPEEPIQPTRIHTVRLADEKDIAEALNADKIPEAQRIPIGLYTSGELIAPVYADSDFLLGPEAGHLNVTGTSGLAAKTSYIEFVIQSIFAHYDKSVAVLLFNVKGSDLLFIDHAPESATQEDKNKYEKLGIPLEPFKEVTYWAPFKEDTVNLATLRTHPDLIHNVKPMQWGMREVMKYTEALLNRDDIDVKADAVLQFIRENAVEPGKFKFNEEEIKEVKTSEMSVLNFAELSAWLKAVIDYCENKNIRDWRSHSTATIRKIYNRLNNLTSRFAGLISEGEGFKDFLSEPFNDRSVTVVDVAGLKSEAQDLVFTRVIAELREKMEQDRLGVDALIVVVDELNQYAPSSGRDSYIAGVLRDIAARGRYLKLVLFGAQQFRSQVDRQVVGNCSTAAWGQIEAEELSQPGYSVFDIAVKEKLGSLSQGQMLVKHPHFKQPIFIGFPKPCIMRGRDGILAYPPQKDTEWKQAICRRLKELDRNITQSEVSAAIDDASGNDENSDKKRALSALHSVLRERPADVLRTFKVRLGEKPKTAGIYREVDTEPRSYTVLEDDFIDPFT